METSLTVVEGFRYTGNDFNLRIDMDLALSVALDQRAFGPRQLVVVTANSSEEVIGLAHCERTTPPELALKCCLETLDDGAANALAFSDEPVTAQRPGDLQSRFEAAQNAAALYDVHLVDWFMCDDTVIRSMWISLRGGDDWRDLPAG